MVTPPQHSDRFVRTINSANREDVLAIKETGSMKDVKLVGVLNIVWGLMGVTGGVIGGLILFLPAILAQAGYLDRVPRREADTLTAILGLIAGAIIIIALVVSLPSLIGGIGLLKGRSWARMLVLVISFFNLLAFPLGTALGVYGIYVLWDQPLESSQRQTSSQVSPVPGPTS
jgi:hypothetical protein